MTSVLMILTGAKVWTMKDGTPHPTGFWSDEFVTPHQKFTAAGFEVHVATPGGVRPTVDPLSLAPAFNNNDQGFIDAQKAYVTQVEEVLSKPIKLADADPASYDVVFVVGGHGPMQDLAVDPNIGDLLAAMLDNPSKIVAAICHGPAGFLSAHRADGTWLFKGRELTGFSNQEETQASFAGNSPWLLEDRLRLAGANYVAKPAWTPHAVVDGNLITGQQSSSAGVTADAVLQKLKVKI
jgi:putative intracellular protease/amidase